MENHRHTHHRCHLRQNVWESVCSSWDCFFDHGCAFASAKNLKMPQCMLHCNSVSAPKDLRPAASKTGILGIAGPEQRCYVRAWPWAITDSEAKDSTVGLDTCAWLQCRRSLLSLCGFRWCHWHCSQLTAVMTMIMKQWSFKLLTFGRAAASGRPASSSLGPHILPQAVGIEDSHSKRMWLPWVLAGVPELDFY